VTSAFVQVHVRILPQHSALFDTEISMSLRSSIQPMYVVRNARYSTGTDDRYFLTLDATPFFGSATVLLQHLYNL